MPTTNKAAGFTLIEVLVASIILFMFIMMASQAFSQSAQSSLKAERAVKVAGIVPLLVDNIKSEIFAAKTLADVVGEGHFQQVNYSWKATLVERKPPIEGFDPLLLDFRSYKDKYNLWRVDLTVSVDKYQRHWVYEELTWHQ